MAVMGSWCPSLQGRHLQADISSDRSVLIYLKALAAAQSNVGTGTVIQSTPLPSRPPFLTVPLCDRSCWSCRSSSLLVGKYQNIAYPMSKWFCLQDYKYHMKGIYKRIYLCRRNEGSHKSPSIEVPLTPLCKSLPAVLAAQHSNKGECLSGPAEDELGTR